jgi:ADP-heptose:LPS heptosyltransferase
MNVLIIKMGALGDVIMSTSIIRKIVDHHADDRVCLLTSPGYAHLFQGWPGLAVHGLPRRGLLAMVKTLIWIRKSRYTRIYDLQSSERTAMLCLLSGVAERAGNHPGPAYTLHPHTRYNGRYHAVERLNEILVSAGVSPCLTAPFLPVSDESKLRVLSWLSDAGLTDKSFVIMHAGASAKHPQKRWPRFAELALQFEALGIKTVWLGGKEDEAINTVLAALTGINTTGQFTIQEEAELGRHARFAVTNDSAPMHILSCSGIPVFGLFGPTDWRRSHAVGQKMNVIALDELHDTTCQFVSHDLANLSVSHVLDRIARSGLLPASP